MLTRSHRTVKCCNKGNALAAKEALEDIALRKGWDMVVGLDATAFSAPTLSPGMFALLLTVFPRCTYRKHLTFSPGVGRIVV